MKIKTRRYYMYYLAKAAMWATYLLPIRAMIFLGDLAGRIAFKYLDKYRHITIENLKTAFPKKNEKWVNKTAERVFANLAANYAMFSQISKLNGRNIHRWVKPHGLKHFDKAFADGKGCIVLATHFGNWELLGSYIPMAGYPAGTIVRKMYFHKFDKIIDGLRSHAGLKLFDRNESMKKMLKYLMSNKILGILPDQDIEGIDGVFVDFFGRPAFTPTGPVKFALVSGAPIVPCFMVRTRKYKYDFYVNEPIYVDNSMDRAKAEKYYTERWTKALESYIMKYPDQWVWMHRRWKTKKEDVIEKK